MLLLYHDACRQHTGSVRTAHTHHIVVPIVESSLPEVLVNREVAAIMQPFIAGPCTVHKDIESPLLNLQPLEQCFGFSIDTMITSHADADAALCRDSGCRFFDGSAKGYCWSSSP